MPDGSPMKKLKVNLTNCHGIHRLEAEISFKDANAAAIYAPNGMMKTSFARTFGDLARGLDSRDHLFPDRPSERKVTDEGDVPVAADQVVVIVSYDEEMGPTPETSTLLVDKVLRDEYETLQRGIYESKAELVAALKLQAGTKKDVSKALSLAFTRDDESFFQALLRIENEIADEDGKYQDVPYDTVFDDKVLALLRTDEFAQSLGDYVERFNSLLDASTYFSRDTFSYYNAETVAKSLGANGFFEASHTILLNASEGTQQLRSQKELADLIELEKKTISDDAALRETFASMESKLTKNVESRRFWTYISENQFLLPELVNVEDRKSVV